MNSQQDGGMDEVGNFDRKWSGIATVSMGRKRYYEHIVKI